MPKTVVLPSGAKLEMHLCPIAEAIELQETLAEEGKGIKMGSARDVLDPGLYKDVVAFAIASKAIKKAMLPAIARVLYNGIKIGPDTFEPEEARQDYWWVYYHTLRFNLEPFTRSLSAKLPGALRQIAQQVLAEVMQRPDLLGALAQLPGVSAILKDLASKSGITSGSSTTDSSGQATAT